MPRHVESTRRWEFNADKYSVEDLDGFPNLGHIANIADLESHPLPTAPRQTETYPGASAPLCNYTAEPWERDAQSCLATNLQNNPYYPFATGEEYKYLQCGITKKGMKTYHDNMLKDENTALRLPSVKNGDCVQKLVACMPDN
jgi:hypothetical protein